LTDSHDNLNTLFTNVKPVRDKIAYQGYFHDSDNGLIESGYDIVELESVELGLIKSNHSAISIVCEDNLSVSFHSNAFTPGNTLPSKYSSKAPPPVDT
jgi:hypothetical protein